MSIASVGSLTSTRQALPANHRLLHPAFMAWAVGIVTAHAAAPTDAIRNVVYLVAIAQVPVALIIGHIIYGVSRKLMWLTAAMATSFLLTEVLAALQAPDRNGRFSVAIEVPRVFGQLLFVAAIGFVVRARRGQQTIGLLADGAIVAVATWLLTWTTLIVPALGDSPGLTAATVVKGLSTPLGVVNVFLLVMVLLGDLRRSLAVWMLCLTIVLTLIGDIGYAAVAAEHLSIPSSTLDTFYVGAYLAGAAIFLDARVDTLTRTQAVDIERSPTERVALLGVSTLAPMIVLALTDSASTVDRLVRAVSAASLTAIVTFRILEAMRADARAQRRLVLAAQHDSLTGLPNRTLVDSQISEALLRSAVRGGRPTVLFIDLDRFKTINDGLGHATGDEILRIVGRNLRLALPAEVVLGRISGDEFIALDPTTRSVGEAMALAERALNTFRTPIRFGATGPIHVSASIGIAVASPHTRVSADELQRNADIAMYRAKESGRNCMALYDDSMHHDVATRLSLESALHGALDRNEIQLDYQPIVDLTTGCTTGFEALMRWRPDDAPAVSPSVFIPIAEDTGLIGPLGAWTLVTALHQLRHWIVDGTCDATTSMSVNVSARQLRDPAFIPMVKEALFRTGIAPQQLWLEVTESMLIEDMAAANSALGQLRAHGVHLAIDDFGTGYSSLSLISRFPLQRLKIDQSFVRHITRDQQDRALVRTMLAMAEALGLEAVAEGVENLAQFDALRQLGCGRAQGYLFSRPVAPDQVTRGRRGLEFGAEPDLDLLTRFAA